jgi:head-tail adaptor
MDAGKLNKRITIYRITGTDDGYGGTTKSKATLKTIWGNVKYTGGDVETQAGQRMQNTNVEVIVREPASTDLLFTDTISIGNDSAEYNINSILESELDEYVTIKATKSA